MLLTLAVFIVAGWLLFQIVKLAIKITWCFAKIIACIISVIAVPLLIIFVVFTGGAILFLPVILLGIALLILESC